MANITDKFGKASIDTDYAIATTVKTTRVPGATVLEAFDLSKFSDDTPVFFVTYKKTTDPVTDITSVTNLISWKGLVNTGANTLTNLELAPGYADTGNAIGDFVECIPTSHWENSLIDGILAHANPDGSLRPDAVKTALNIDTTSPDWTPLATLPNSVAYNGNRSYQVTIPGIDYTDRIQPGTRVRTTRTVAAPTQGTSLNGSTQYWLKTTPNKLAFNDNFTLMAWITPTAYQQGVILGRADAAPNNGWVLRLTATGQLEVAINNGGGSNYRVVTAYQSVQVGRKQHVAATWAAGVVSIYIDGVSIPVAPALSGGTAPTTSGAGGDYAVGRYGAFASQYFAGTVWQTAAFNAVLSAATIRSYISQGLAGTETNLQTAHSFNGVATDLNTTTPNDLTAFGSAGYVANSPFGTQASGLINGLLDYGIVQAATFSTNTTLTVQVPEGCTIPTSGGVSSVSYSSVKAPYGFPTSNDKWYLNLLIKTRQQQTIANLVWSAINNTKVTVPTGCWVISGGFWPLATSGSTAAFLESQVTLSTSNNTVTWDGNLPLAVRASLQQNGTQSPSITGGIETDITLSVSKDIYVINQVSGAVGSAVIYLDYADVKIKNAYL